MRSGPRSVSAVRSLEVVASRRLVMYYQSGPEALSSLGSVSASRSVRFRRFYCIHSVIWVCLCCPRHIYSSYRPVMTLLCIPVSELVSFYNSYMSPFIYYTYLLSI